MGIGAGDLDKRITFLRNVDVRGETSRREEFVPASKAWAAVRYVSDAEKFSAAQTKVSAVLRFTIRRRSDVTHNWRIQFEGQDYRIVGIKPLLADTSFLEITAGNV